jgi:hypothetical protein
MIHPPFDRLRAFATGDVEPHRQKTARHLEECADCRQTVTRVRDLLVTVRADAPRPPAGALERIRARRAAGERVILPVVEPDERRRGAPRLRSVLPWAVAFVLASAGLAVALPGSPLREFLRSRGASKARVDSVATLPTPVSSEALREGVAADTAVAGVALPYMGSDLAVIIAVPAESLVVIVRLTDDGELEVRGSGGAANAVFRMHGATVAVSGVKHGTVHVDVPRIARRFELRIGGQRYLVSEGGSMRALADADTTEGAVIFRVRR